ncbi:MAG: hypothetical protein BWZ00_01918 [Bacteroidetes bacterium ADurb.BinA174]|nr:MAG: hypothetical protein BWZ00_01918 [Bacteroidetes bacterium ADurb.BinA174]
MWLCVFYQLFQTTALALQTSKHYAIKILFPKIQHPPNSINISTQISSTQITNNQNFHYFQVFFTVFFQVSSITAKSLISFAP